MEFKNEKGEIVGADVDIAAEFAKDLGVKLEIVNTPPWMSLASSLPERARSLKFASDFAIS